MACVLCVVACSGDQQRDDDADGAVDADVSADADTRDVDVLRDADEDSSADAEADADGDGVGDADVDEGCEVVELESPCLAGVGSLSRASCQRLEVRCPELGQRAVEVRISRPPVEVSSRGLLVISSDGAGTGFVEEVEAAPAMLDGLLDEGFTIVQRAWDEPGWLRGSSGPGEHSRRGAALLRWIDQHLREGDQPFCAAGNGHGASELVYALEWWGADALLDLVVATSGPTLSRLDLGCLGDVADEDWIGRCGRIVPSCSVYCFDRQACTFDEETRVLIDESFGGEPLCSSPDGANRERLRAASVMFEEGELSFSATRYHALTGTLDCTASVPLALELVNAVSSERDIGCVHASEHDFWSNADGVDALREAILVGCVRRH